MSEVSFMPCRPSERRKIMQNISHCPLWRALSPSRWCWIRATAIEYFNTLRSEAVVTTAPWSPFLKCLNRGPLNCICMRHIWAAKKSTSWSKTSKICLQTRHVIVDFAPWFSNYTWNRKGHGLCFGCTCNCFDAVGSLSLLIHQQKVGLSHLVRQ